MACNLCTLPVNAKFRLAWWSLGVEQGHLRALPSYADEEAGSYSRLVLSPLLSLPGGMLSSSDLTVPNGAGSSPVGEWILRSRSVGTCRPW